MIHDWEPTTMRTHRSRLGACLLGLTCVLAAVAASSIANGATITVINRDNAGEGFNDPTPVSPVGGNSGTTLGAQRLNAFQFAANLWGALLNSPVEIRVGANFDRYFAVRPQPSLARPVPQTSGATSSERRLPSQRPKIEGF
jgi:hypothetical protein